MRNSGSARFYNVLSVIMLMATACLTGFYALVGLNIYNPFPRPPAFSLAQLPTSTTTPTPAIPTWTPTYTPTAMPTSEPTNTYTPKPSPTPLVFPTDTPTPTPTPRVTRAPWPFTCAVEYGRPVAADNWSGVAGHVQDLDGNPLPGYIVRVEGPASPGVFFPVAGADAGINNRYGNDAAWEQVQNPTAYQEMEIRVQLFDSRPSADGTHTALSDVIVVRLGGYPGASLGYVTCTKNWENWP